MKFSLLWLAPGAIATWNTLYALQDGKAYLHLSNNDLISLDFSISGTGLNLLDSQQIATISSPPQNSSVFLYNEILYAFSGDSTAESDQDVCGDGSLTLSQYNSTINNWANIPLNFSQIQDTSYYQDASYLTPELTSTESMYIYGGICQSSNKVTNRLLSFNPLTGLFSNITTTTKPQPFYGASNLLAPNPQTQLIIGGQSTSNGWLNMYQLATWAFSSGWSFEQVLSPSSTSATTNSRKQGLALPIFLPLANNSRTTILNQYSTSSILLLGGSVASDKTLLFASRLSTDSNAWSWDDIPSNFTKENIAGAATIFNTLVIVNGTIGNENGKYTVNLYDSTSFKPVKNLQSNTQDIPTPSSSSSSSTTTTTAAIVGTIVPVSAIVAAVAVTYFLMKKKKKNEDVDENFDYQIGNYYDQSTIGSKKLGIKNPFISGDRVNSNPYGHNHHMDTNSTLDVQSIDLWVRKRDEFEQNKKLNVPNHNPSFLASSETLSSTESDATRLTNPFEGAISNGAVPVSDESDSSGTPVTKTPILAAAPFTPATPGAGSKSILSSPLIDRSVSRLRKSLSFSTPQPYGLLKRKSTYASKKSSRTPTLFDDEFAYDSDERQIYEGSEGKGDIEREGEGEGEREGEMEESEKKNNEDEDEDDDKSFDDNVDVQVLVSSKRRSVLRVVNPDLETVAEEESLRQRIPSGPIDPEL